MVTLLGYSIYRSARFGSFLVRIFGIGLNSARAVCRAGGVPFNKRITSTPVYKIKYIETLIDRRFLREFRIRRTMNGHLFFKYTNGFNSGLRLAQGLPSRNQRNKTNGRTARRLKIDFSKMS